MSLESYIPWAVTALCVVGMGVQYDILRSQSEREYRRLMGISEEGEVIGTPDIEEFYSVMGAEDGEQ